MRSPHACRKWTRRTSERVAKRAERLRQELAARREAHQTLILELERQAGAWSRAQFLRRYLRAARRALGDRPHTVDLDGTPTDFLSWAEHYVNQLDPLTSNRTISILMHETPHPSYYGNPKDRDRFREGARASHRSHLGTRIKTDG